MYAHITIINSLLTYLYRKIKLHSFFCRTRIYRERGERFEDNCIIERDSHGGGSVMVWASVSLHHKTNIVFIKGNLTAARHRHEVLDMEVIPLLRNHRRMQLLHDGAPAYLARTTTAYLNANNVNVGDPPNPKSSDLNIIENIWDELNRRVRRKQGLFRPH